MFGPLMPDVTTYIQTASPQSLGKITLVMVLKLGSITISFGFPSDVKEIPPGSIKSYLLQPVILK